MEFKRKRPVSQQEIENAITHSEVQNQYGGNLAKSYFVNAPPRRPLDPRLHTNHTARKPVHASSSHCRGPRGQVGRQSAATAFRPLQLLSDSTDFSLAAFGAEHFKVVTICEPQYKERNNTHFTQTGIRISYTEESLIISECKFVTMHISAMRLAGCRFVLLVSVRVKGRVSCNCS